MTPGRHTFSARVLAFVAGIPAGRIATYGDIAALSGNPKAARAVGTIMRTAPRRGLPYHRVVGSGGSLGGYGGRGEMKAALLRAEGVIVRGTRIVNFRTCRWTAKPPSRRRSSS
jgi:methylated-DNA-protein-cysteine methyltransferase-like protein